MIIGTQANSHHEQNVKRGRETMNITFLASQTKSVYCHKGMLDSSTNDFIRSIYRKTHFTLNVWAITLYHTTDDNFGV